MQPGEEPTISASVSAAASVMAVKFMYFKVIVCMFVQMGFGICRHSVAALMAMKLA